MTVIEILPPLEPLGGVKVRISKFQNKSVINIFTEILTSEKDTINMKHVNDNLGLKFWV